MSTLTDINGEDFVMTAQNSVNASSGLRNAVLDGAVLEKIGTSVGTFTQNFYAHGDGVGSTATPDNLGLEALAISRDGNWVIAGAYGDETNFKYNHGTAIIYKKGSDGSFQEHQVLKPEDVAYQYWGKAVAISSNGEYVALSKRTLYGGVKVYKRNTAGDYVAHGGFNDKWVDNQWVTPTFLEGPISRKDFGAELSISDNGDRVAIGERGSGLIRVAYLNSSNKWSLSNNTIVGASAITTPAYQNTSGLEASFAISPDGYQIAVGRTTGTGVNSTGQVDIYNVPNSATQSGTNPDWVLNHTINAPTGFTSFGRTVSFSSYGRAISVSDRTTARVAVFTTNSTLNHGGIPDWGNNYTTQLGSTIFANDSQITVNTKRYLGTSAQVAKGTNGTFVIIGSATANKTYVYKYNEDNTDWVKEHEIGTPPNPTLSELHTLGGLDVGISTDANTIVTFNHVSTDGFTNHNSNGSLTVYDLTYGGETTIYADLTGVDMTGATGTGITPANGAGVSLPEDWSIVGGVLSHTDGNQGLGLYEMADVYKNQLNNDENGRADSFQNALRAMNQTTNLIGSEDDKFEYNVDMFSANMKSNNALRRLGAREMFRAIKHRGKYNKKMRVPLANLGLEERAPAGKTHALVLDNGATIVSSDVASDELIYAPIQYLTEQITLENYGSNNETITFEANGDGTYSATLNDDGILGPYSESETPVQIAGKWWIFGSVSESDPPPDGGSGSGDSGTGSGSGDPHIVAMNGQIYELPDKVASYRMYQGNNLTINASTRFFTEQEKEAIQQYYLSKTGDVANVYNLVTDGVVQNKVFIKNGDHLMTYNFDTNALQSNQEVSYSASKNGVVTINLENATHGKVSVRLTHYANPQVYSGVTVSVQAQSSNHGLLVREYESADYEIDSLCNTSPVKEGRRATTSARTQLRKN